MQRLEQASRNVILLLFLIKTTVDAYMPVFALIALVAYSVSLALIIPGLLQKNSGWRRMAILSAVIALISHAFALESRIIPGDGSVQNLSVLNVGSLVSLMICTVMTIVASKNRGWLLLPIVYAFALINLALATFMPNEFITHLEATPGMLVHIGLSLFSYATLIIAALYAMQLAWIDYQLKNKKLAFNHEMPPLMVIERKMFHITQVGVVLLTLTLCTGLFYMKTCSAWRISTKRCSPSSRGLSILCCYGAIIMRAGAVVAWSGSMSRVRAYSPLPISEVASYSNLLAK